MILLILMPVKICLLPDDEQNLIHKLNIWAII